MRGVKPQLVVSNQTVNAMPKPAPPAYLSKVAKDEWRRVVPDLIARGLFTDPPLVEQYCNAVSGAREAAQARRGKVMLDGKSHPAVRMEQQYLEIARRYAGELGLSPVGRQRTSGGKPPESDSDDDWA